MFQALQEAQEPSEAAHSESFLFIRGAQGLEPSFWNGYGFREQSKAWRGSFTGSGS